MAKIVRAVPWKSEMETSGLHIDGVRARQATWEADRAYYVKTPDGNVDVCDGDLVATDDIGQKYVFMPRLPEE